MFLLTNAAVWKEENKLILFTPEQIFISLCSYITKVHSCLIRKLMFLNLLLWFEMWTLKDVEYFDSYYLLYSLSLWSSHFYELNFYGLKCAAAKMTMMMGMWCVGAYWHYLFTIIIIRNFSQTFIASHQNDEHCHECDVLFWAIRK